MLVLFNKETFNEEVCTYYSGQKRLEYCRPANICSAELTKLLIRVTSKGLAE